MARQRGRASTAPSSPPPPPARPDIPVNTTRSKAWAPNPTLSGYWRTVPSTARAPTSSNTTTSSEFGKMPVDFDVPYDLTAIRDQLPRSVRLRAPHRRRISQVHYRRARPLVRMGQLPRLRFNSAGLGSNGVSCIPNSTASTIPNRTRSCRSGHELSNRPDSFLHNSVVPVHLHKFIT